MWYRRIGASQLGKHVFASVALHRTGECRARICLLLAALPLPDLATPPGFGAVTLFDDRGACSWQQRVAASEFAGSLTVVMYYDLDTEIP